MKHLTPTLKYCGAQAESRAISLAGHTEGSTKAVSESTEPKKFRGFGHGGCKDWGLLSLNFAPACGIAHGEKDIERAVEALVQEGTIMETMVNPLQQS